MDEWEEGLMGMAKKGGWEGWQAGESEGCRDVWRDGGRDEWQGGIAGRRVD